jgi:hypothetical protein
MAFKIRRVDYFYTTVKDEPGEAYKVLSLLAGLGVKSRSCYYNPLWTDEYPTDDLS